MFVTVVAQLTAKTAISEKAVYFLSFMSYSINKLKSHMLFLSRKFMLYDFTWKNVFAPENRGRRGKGVLAVLLFLLFLCGLAAM